MCTPKNDSMFQFCNVVRTWYNLETIIYYFIRCTSFKTSSITMLSNHSQYSNDVIEQWSCIVTSLQRVQVAEKMFVCVLLDET